MEKMLDSIIGYLKYLNNDLGLSVSVHFCEEALLRLPKNWIIAIRKFNSHNNPYCMSVKNKMVKRDKCICEQRTVYESGIEDSFFKVCHAGVYEHITPVCENKKVIGFVAVSGFRRGKAPEGINIALWEKHLDKGEFPTRLSDVLIPPLAVMLKELFAYCSIADESEDSAILQYLNEYHTNVTLDDLCRHFSRSRSYISHMFRKTYKKTFKEYVNELKLLDAQRLVLNTNMSVTEVAYESGFSDVSYFISCFKKKFGASPLQYRKKSG